MKKNLIGEESNNEGLENWRMMNRKLASKAIFSLIATERDEVYFCM